MWNVIAKKLNDKESLISLGLGVVVVMLSGVLLFNILKSRNLSSSNQQAKIPGTVDENIAESQINNLPAKHVVKDGETIWSISMNYYNSGYNWISIAKANNLENANVIQPGQELDIPNEKPIFPQEGEIAVAGISTTTENVYRVKKGDTLWDISCRTFANCYNWPEIAKANNLSEPYYIEVDQELKLPR
jgi:nucleoid-associated protein YgaU